MVVKKGLIYTIGPFFNIILCFFRIETIYFRIS